jgi:N-hydroxyarylamine O-acetyltransferase
MSDLNLSAYLARIGYEGSTEPTIEVLRSLHRSHALAIPFENLDIVLGRPIRLDLASLQAKLVEHRRGGYCFEHNTLFAAVLDSLGFTVTRLGARVRMGRPAADELPDTHMILAVGAEGTLWLADVGFGGEGLLEPIPFEPGAPVEQLGRSFRLVAEQRAGGAIAAPPLRVLQALHGRDWFDLYAFTLEPHAAIDYEVANWFTSTNPRSPFVNGPVAQRQFPDGWLTLRVGELTRAYTDGRVETTQIARDEELLAILAERFDLSFPPETRFDTSVDTVESGA